MSHHYSGPNIGFPWGDARLDLTDLYVFPKPGDPDKSIVIMNVHPSVGITPPEPTTAEAFAPEALYELKIDTNGDAVAEIAYQVRFSSSDGREPTATLRCAERAQAAGTGEGGEIIIDGVPVSTEREARVVQTADYRFFVGWRSDPFFFDVMGTLNNFQFTGDDFFADKDICSIVLEVPNSVLGPKPVGLWARTLIPADSAVGGWVQADRGARPNQTPFLAGEQNDAYLAGEPADDARFIPVFAHALEHTGGYTPEEAKRVARTLLPDLLCYDPTRAASFPGNGRALNDDVSDAFLAILTNGKVTGDGVGPHADLLAEFPYLGPPHKARGDMKTVDQIETAPGLASRSDTSAPLTESNPLDIIPDEMPFDVAYGFPISLERAQAVIEAAVTEAKKRNWKMNLVVADSGGHLVAFQRMNGAMLASIQIAEHKARAAATFRRPTKIFEDGIQLMGLNYLLAFDDVSASRGGIPLIEQGKLIGAIGCSGGTDSQDEVVSNAGAAVINQLPARNK